MQTCCCCRVRHSIHQTSIQERALMLHTSRGVLNPSPTVRWYLKSFLALLPLRFKKMVGCFWKDFSFYNRTDMQRYTGKLANHATMTRTSVSTQTDCSSFSSQSDIRAADAGRQLASECFFCAEHQKRARQVTSLGVLMPRPTLRV